MPNGNYAETIQMWIDRGEIPSYEIPDDFTIMGRGFCQGDCHTCSELSQCAKDYSPDEQEIVE